MGPISIKIKWIKKKKNNVAFFHVLLTLYFSSIMALFSINPHPHWVDNATLVVYFFFIILFNWGKIYIEWNKENLNVQFCNCGQMYTSMYLKGSIICQHKICLWYKDYLRLIIFKKQQTEEGLSKLRSYLFVRATYIYKGNLHL